MCSLALIIRYGKTRLDSFNVNTQIFFITQRCRLRNSLRSNRAGSGRFVFTLRLTPVRLGLSKKAPLSLGMADTICYIGVGIGHPQRAVRLYIRPKQVSVKRRDWSERPERLLFERSEFQTRQRTKGTE